MIDTNFLSLLSELGLKPMEIMILGMLWQNIKSTRSLLERLTERVREIEVRKRTANQ
jgi:hypothetical protein